VRNGFEEGRGGSGQRWDHHTDFVEQTLGPSPPTGESGLAEFSARAMARGVMTPEQLQKRIETMAPGTQVKITDLTGTMDHYQATVVSPAFQGKIMIEQHRMVMATVQKEIDSGEVHALTMKTYTPEQWEKFGSK